IQRKKRRKGEIKLSLTPTKKELMNRSLSALTINVGKAGVSESLIEEIRRQLKAEELIKVRFARTVASEKESYITEIVEKTNSKLIDLRGNVAIIFKKRS